MSDERFLNKIHVFYRKHRRMPSFFELSRLTGLRSKNAVSKLVDRLCDRGVLAKDTTGRIIPSHGFGEVKALGYVEAGFPSPAEEELVDTMNLDDFLIENKEATFLLHVRGESMKNAGIRDGDLVLVERGREPRNGDIVVAEVDGEWTMKYYRRTARGVCLEPANPEFQTIYPSEALSVAAVVRAVVRKYA